MAAASLDLAQRCGVAAAAVPLELGEFWMWLRLVLWEGMGSHVAGMGRRWLLLHLVLWPWEGVGVCLQSSLVVSSGR